MYLQKSISILLIQFANRILEKIDYTNVATKTIGKDTNLGMMNFLKKCMM